MKLRKLAYKKNLKKASAKAAELRAKLEESKKAQAAPAPSPTIDISGGRSPERIQRNLEREPRRGIESFNNFIAGKGWKHDKRLAKDAEAAQNEQEEKK